LPFHTFCGSYVFFKLYFTLMLLFKHEGIEFCILLCFLFLVYSIIKRVKGMSYVSCNYREQLEFLGTICEVKPCGLRTCLGNKDIAS